MYEISNKINYNCMKLYYMLIKNRPSVCTKCIFDMNKIHPSRLQIETKKLPFSLSEVRKYIKSFHKDSLTLWWKSQQDKFNNFRNIQTNVLRNGGTVTHKCRFFKITTNLLNWFKKKYTKLLRHLTEHNTTKVQIDAAVPE